MDKRVRASIMAAVLALALALAPAAPARASDDVVAPSLAAFSVTPSEVDVTSESATLAVSLRVTDSGSGVDWVGLSWADPHARGHGIQLTRTSGDAHDNTWSGSFTVPRNYTPGVYGFHLWVRDAVGNIRNHTPGTLDEMGFAARFTVVNDDPDITAPVVRAVRISPAVADVRGGPATVTFEVDAHDNQSGLTVIGMYITGPRDTNSGVRTPFSLRHVAGTEYDGTWQGTTTVPQHAHAGRFRIDVSLRDWVRNERLVTTSELAAAGTTSGFDVVSEEDVTPPRFELVSLSRTEVDIHEADQTVTVRVRVSDDLAGVGHWALDRHRVWIEARHALYNMTERTEAMPRVSGTALDGEYEATITFRRGSTTGRRQVLGFAEDAVANAGSITASEIANLGGTDSLLVYDVPPRPTLSVLQPGDGRVTVHFYPVSDGGAPITEYIVHESPDGVVKNVDGDARSVVIDGLRNGVEHTFTVTAVNKAGASDPSAPRSATPRPAESPTTMPTTTPTTSATTPTADPAVGAPRASGYSMVDVTGAVYAFGQVPWLGNAPVGETPAVDIESTPSGRGYWVVDARGQIFAFGDARHLGGGVRLEPGEAVTSISRTPSGRGYWTFTSRGRAFPYGDARHLGDLGAVRLNGPVLDSVATPSGNGYYLVASDGGVFAFGDARFAGSMGNARLNAPVQSLVPDPDGRGYWLVASDGGIFAFEAPFHGSMGGTGLNRPVTGMVGSPTGGGYLMVAEDGGIFAFGDVRFHGSLGNRPPAAPVTAVATPTSG